MCRDWEKVNEQSSGPPMVVLVASVLKEDEAKAHVTMRLLLNNRCHDSMAGTGATCAAACSQIPGSVVRQALRQSKLKSDILRMQHPLGVTLYWVAAKDGGKYILDEEAEVDRFSILAFVRTSRRIMEGEVYIPDYIWDEKFY